MSAAPDEVEGYGTRPAHAAKMHRMGSQRAQAKLAVLVLGGYGFSGQRICESLAANSQPDIGRALGYSGDQNKAVGRDLGLASRLIQKADI